ncbi:MAG: metalloregulator ArsR/SmtB family transcription factor [Sneathiellales bacterium]|nr:metalloregulator ArsR/SmtB family transcription factor [Sneathiellales bacterium]
MTTDPLSRIFGALADPTRRAILEQLTEGEKTAGQLAKPFKMSAPAISRHLKVLETAELIERKVDAQWRRCSLNAEGLQKADDWVARYRTFWDKRLDALDTYLLEMKQKAGTSNE